MFLRSKYKREKIIVQSNTKNDNNFQLKISKVLHTNIDNLENMLDKPDDLVIRKLQLSEKNISCAVVYINGISDELMIQQNILNNLEIANMHKHTLPETELEMQDYIFRKLIAIGDIEIGKTFDTLSLALLSGKTIFYIDGVNTVLILDTVGGDKRSIEEPVSETLIRGPRKGFIEDIETNLSMIRHHLKDPNLRFKTYKTGRRSKQDLVVAYIDGIIEPAILNEIKRRLKTIDIDNIPESGYIEEWIEDSFLSPFPQMQNTERPDKVITAILQGKAAIFIDHTPFVLLAPMNFTSVLQSPEDYYERWTIGSLLRILRYLSAFISIFLPALYIALISFNPGMIPQQLAFSIAATREGVPFPAIIEAMLMVITMELLQEAGARLPQTIGQTIGIVGGLVIGEAAVQAGIVSPVMVIVIALTAIANFAIPSFSAGIAFRIIRFAFMLAASFLGLFGIVLVYIMVNIHLVNLRSFGVPYSAPFAPFYYHDWNDTVIRLPIISMRYRPQYLNPEDATALDKRGNNSEKSKS